MSCHRDVERGTSRGPSPWRSSAATSCASRAPTLPGLRVRWPEERRSAVAGHPCACAAPCPAPPARLAPAATCASWLPTQVGASCLCVAPRAPVCGPDIPFTAVDDADAELEKRLAALGKGTRDWKDVRSEREGKAKGGESTVKASSSAPVDDASWAGETVFFEGPPSRGDLAVNVLLGVTLLWLARPLASPVGLPPCLWLPPSPPPHHPLTLFHASLNAAAVAGSSGEGAVGVLQGHRQAGVGEEHLPLCLCDFPSVLWTLPPGGQLVWRADTVHARHVSHSRGGVRFLFADEGSASHRAGCRPLGAFCWRANVAHGAVDRCREAVCTGRPLTRTCVRTG